VLGRVVAPHTVLSGRTRYLRHVLARQLPPDEPDGFPCKCPQSLRWRRLLAETSGADHLGSTTATFGECHARQPWNEHTLDAQAGNLITSNQASALPQRHARETSVNPVSLLGRQWRISKLGPWSTIPRVPNWIKHVPGFLRDYMSSLVGQAHVYVHRVPPVSRHTFEP
jgi:hypothetical protein